MWHIPGFLLDACDRMLRLLQPVGPGTANPEVDYSLVIRMVRSLVVAAKVKHARAGLNTGVAHCDQLLSQVDLLNMLVKHGCSALIPAEPLNGHALRRLRDRLVEEELWMLAMEVSTKGGLDRTGVWAAWGKACLRAGCWDEAREKFSHCLEKVVFGLDLARPPRNPPLLSEIIQILEEGAYTVDRKVLQQADKIRASKDIPIALLSSPALTVLHTLSSLKEIAQGNYPQATPPLNTVVIGPKLDPLFYEECRYYLSTYGSHAGIISFHLSHDDLPAALKHVLVQKVDSDIFLETIYIPCLRQGLVSDLYQELSNIDSTLEVWKLYLCHVCHHLEKQGLLNVLYQLQLHMKDYVRAAMTCIRFYLMGARNYTDLASNLEHLNSAQDHLENELLTAHWGASNRSSPARKMEGSLQLAMKLNPRDIDRHISTILRQMEVTKFLHGCEMEQPHVLDMLPEVFKHWPSDYTTVTASSVPTLFGSSMERMQLAVLSILCGKNVEEGFSITSRIIEDYHLKALQVYSLAGKKLARDGRLAAIEQLISCIQSSGMSDVSSMCDTVLVLCVQVLAEKQDPGDVEPLVKLIADTGNKISAYIECRQLKSAYLLAVKYSRLEDVRRILHEAQKLGQTKIQQICLKRLGQQV